MIAACARAAGAVAAVLALSGCAGLITAERLPAGEPFDILGRVLAIGEGRAFSSGFRWRHDADADEIWLLSPTGQVLAHIAATADEATLTAADQQQYRALSAESLMQRALGWALPLDRLQHWVRGTVIPGRVVAAAVRDAPGRLSELEQDGWRIHYAYAEAPAGTQQPRRLDLIRGTQQIRLVIDEWRHNQP